MNVEHIVTSATSTPPGTAAIPGDAPVVDLDVREELRNGREPFSIIMSVVQALGPSEVLHLRATFEPVPLFRVMAKRGYANRVEEHAPDDWSVWFYRASDAPAADVAAATSAAPKSATPTTPAVHADVVLDARELEPPEPMVRTLEALESMPNGQVLLQINARVPQFLLPILRDRGFAYEIDETRADEVHTRIWRRASPVDAA